MVGTIEQYAHGLLEACLGLDDDLTAGTTRTGRFGQKLALAVAHGNGQHQYGLVGILRTGSKNGRTLSAEAGREGSVLLIAAGHDDAVLQ